MGGGLSGPHPTFYPMIVESEEAMTSAVIREIMTGEQLKQQFEAEREANSARIAEEYRGTKSRGGLMHLAEIPQREFMLLCQWYGPDWVSDRSMVKHVQKTHPQFFSHSA